MSHRVRVFLIGLKREDLNLLRRKSQTDEGLDIVGEALLRDVQDGTVRPPDSIDGVLMTPAAQSAVVEAPRLRPDAPRDDRLIEELTPRERDVVALVADGHPNREIAARLDISEHTVKFHLASIFGKLGVSTRTQAVRRALEWGLIEI